jgi:hypothetical protein
MDCRVSDRVAEAVRASHLHARRRHRGPYGHRFPAYDRVPVKAAPAWAETPYEYVLSGYLRDEVRTRSETEARQGLTANDALISPAIFIGCSRSHRG